MLTEMRVNTKHITLKEKIVPIGLLSPVVVACLLPYFSRLSKERQIPRFGPSA